MNKAYTYKKDSQAWKLAQRICRRRGANKIPVALSDDGNRVQFMSLIRGNTWWVDLSELMLLSR